MQQLGGAGQAPLDASTMFLEDAFASDDSSKGKKLLECTPVEDDVKIHNSSCVLTPQVTQGE